MGADDEPDWPALYLRHRGAMYRVAVRTLWKSGLAAQAEDVVHDAFTSLMASPPVQPVNNWEALLIRAVKMKAIDLLRSAATVHAGGTLDADVLPDVVDNLEDEVATSVDAVSDGAVLWDSLAMLDERERQILWEHKALGRTRDAVARDFNISPGRVSQICIAAMQKLQPALREGGVQR